MPEYVYVAQTHDGAIERGQISSSDPAQARAKLSQRGRRLVGIQETANPTSPGLDALSHFRRRHFRPVRSYDIGLMLQQLAVMLESGLELTPSLRELSHHGPKRIQQLCSELAEAVERGHSFAKALSNTRLFPPVVIQLVRVGEQTGELPTTMQRAAEFIENRRQALSNLLSALAYPVLVAIAACSVAAYLVGWAIPKLAAFLHAMGRDLPSMTQTLLDVAGRIQVFGPQLLVMLATGAITLALVYAWQPGRYRIDKALLRLPLIGSLLRMAETHQLANSLALMLRSGVFLPDALERVEMLHYNQYLARQVAESRQRIAMGNAFAGSIHDRGFAPMLSSMIAVGERTGDLPKALEHVAKFYAVQVETKLKRIGSLIEPAIIVIVGGIVGYVYIAFFMALMSAGGNFR